MSTGLFRVLLMVLGLGFAAAFCVIVIPPLIENPDILGAAASGFVNPYASGYSLDVIMCWSVLAVWVIHEATTRGVRHGWIALALGVVPGVATGFAFYLLVRARQVRAAI